MGLYANEVAVLLMLWPRNDHRQRAQYEFELEKLFGKYSHGLVTKAVEEIKYNKWRVGGPQLGEIKDILDRLYQEDLANSRTLGPNSEHPWIVAREDAKKLQNDFMQRFLTGGLWNKYKDTNSRESLLAWVKEAAMYQAQMIAKVRHVAFDGKLLTWAHRKKLREELKDTVYFTIPTSEIIKEQQEAVIPEAEQSNIDYDKLFA